MGARRGVPFLLLVVPWLAGCSVAMALSGKQEPNFEAVQAGSTRQQVEVQLGHPVSEKTLADGNKEVTYKYEMGNSPNGGRATVNFYIDLATLLLAEVILTPIELFQGHDEESQVTYDSRDRVVRITGYNPTPTSETERAARQEQDKYIKKPETESVSTQPRYHPSTTSGNTPAQ
jgi:hypothetical protein